MRGWPCAVIAGLILAAAVCAGNPVAAAALNASPQPYVLPNTQMRSIHSEETGADYQLLIATPRDYQTSGKTYPVVYMLDADYSFALTRNIVQHFVERQLLPEMILVAIAYPQASEDREVYMRTRTRDYTPTLSNAGYGGRDEKLGRGGAVRFRNFIANEVIPAIAMSFQVSADRTFIGHSYGGLFGTYVLLTEPELFKRYVIVSPSLWYENRMIFAVERSAARARPIERHAFFAIGSQETRTEMGVPMVEELKQFFARLKARRDPMLDIAMQIYPGETHASIFPGAVTRGLLMVFEPGADGQSAQARLR